MNNEFATASFAHRTGATVTFARTYLSNHYWDSDIAYEAFELEKHKLWWDSWQSQLTKHIALASGNLELPTRMAVSTVEPLLKLVAGETRMTIEYAYMCLAATDFDIRKAIDTFHKCQDTLPPEAFQLVCNLSSRTGMTACYSQRCLKDSNGNYADAVASFSRSFGQLPQQAFGKHSTTITFFDLPAELRNSVYELVISDDEHQDLDGLTDVSVGMPSILWVNAQVRAECLSVYLCNVSFSAWIFTSDIMEPKQRVDPIHAKYLLDWLDLLGVSNIPKIKTLTIFGDDYFDCIHGCFDDDYRNQRFDAWDYVATSLKCRGVQARQLRFASILESDYQRIEDYYDIRVISRILFNCIIASELFDEKGLVDPDYWPPSIEDMITAGWEAEKGMELSSLQRRRLGWAGQEVKLLVQKWRAAYGTWLFQKREKMNGKPGSKKNRS